MKRMLRSAALALGTTLFSVSLVAAQGMTAAASEGQTLGHLFIAALAGGSVTLLYVIATRVRTRRRTSYRV